MFTRAEAMEFAIEQGFKNPNFVYVQGDRMQVYLLKDGCSTCLKRSSGPYSVGLSAESLFAFALRGREDGWIVSGKLGGVWKYYFDAAGDEIPHG